MMKRTEAQIMENWQCQSPPLVSIICVVYNQEAYVIDAIESLLAQQTNFRFEIVIQDDASTDNTPSIIESYVKKYPHIIKPIFHKENQFSQYRKNILLTAIPYAQGEYIAICEGDDYWINSNKLSVQISQMQQHPQCDVSFHPVLRRYVNGKKRENVFSAHTSHNQIFTTKQLILGGGGFCPTASFVFKRSVFNAIPEWFLDAPIGDYFWQILASLKGGALYINQVMAVYRVGSIGSWSERMAKDEDYVYDYFVRMLKSLKDINAYTNNTYIKEFNFIKNKICFSMCRNPLLSLERRQQIFSENKFNFIHNITWHLVYKNKKTCRFVSKLKYYIWD